MTNYRHTCIHTFKTDKKGRRKLSLPDTSDLYDVLDDRYKGLAQSLRDRNWGAFKDIEVCEKHKCEYYYEVT